MHIKETIFDHEFDVIASLAEGAIRASVDELRERDRLTIALRTALRQGADINDLSAHTGLPVKEIWRRAKGDLHVLNDLDILAGVA